jgi:TonB-linked SusC/RagA family outer membrane protein
MKKNGIGLSRPLWWDFKKLVLMTKLTIFLSLFFVVQLSANVYSQTMLNVDSKNKTVKEVLLDIEKQSEFRFFYNEQFTDLNRYVKFDINNESIDAAMGKLFESSHFTYKIMENNLIVITPGDGQQQNPVSGKVTDEDGLPLPGVTVIVKGTTQGTVTNVDGNYSIPNIPENAVLQFSFVGMKTQEVLVGNQTSINLSMAADAIGIDEVVAIGYGTQKKSDITGTVASLGQERLESVPNFNIAQAIQGAIPGVSIIQTSAGADPETSFMIRGRNSIKASNTPLVIIDGVPGSLNDVNPNDVKSIEILKDASSAAIYGSRGSNGVVLITTKMGKDKKPTLSYSGYYSIQKLDNIPNFMDGGEFYNFKKVRDPSAIKQWDTERYESGDWNYWPDLAFQTGIAHKHNLSISGKTENTNYYVSGSYFDVNGIAVNDKNKEASIRINFDVKISKWITVGTKTQLTFNDQSGANPDMSAVFKTNPLGEAYDSEGNLTIFPIPYEPNHPNPLAPTIYDDIDKSSRIYTNNYLDIDLFFIPGLTYRLNTAVSKRYSEVAQYRGRNTMDGFVSGGTSLTNRSENSQILVDNIVSYHNDFGKHTISGTLLYSVESNKRGGNQLNASRFPSDLLIWYASAQAENIIPSYSYSDENLISQMARLNYSFASKYLLTLTSRRDGYSGFGQKTKWGVFPSVAVGWNIHNEDFFQSDFMSLLKLRTSYGLNGNQAVGPYQTVAKLTSSGADMVALNQSLPGFLPSTLAQDNLGWESSKTLNIGVDFGFLQNRIQGDVNIYKTNTFDLLLDRTISYVHGINSITQNIGETMNKGIELSINSTNVSSGDFNWRTTGNLSFNSNKIVSLYGLLNEQGQEVDDVANAWFIGSPINVNYTYKWLGTWQQDEATEAAKYGQQPGFVKIEDINHDDKIDAKDRQILGQRDPKFLWGLTNGFEFKNFSLNLFIHGMHGVTRINDLKTDHAEAEVKRNITLKKWWTPDNPTNDWIVNNYDAEFQGGVPMRVYENAGFVRLKEISIGYDLPRELMNSINFKQLHIYVTGRNLMTLTKYEGTDPELSGTLTIPLQREYVIGLDIKF